MDEIMRPPYITESAREYFHAVVEPFLKKVKIGYRNNTNYCGSYSCFHWFKEENDNIKAFIVEIKAE